MAPSVDLTKSVVPVSLAEPGGVFTFTLARDSDWLEAGTITVLGDDYTTAPGLRVDVADPVGAGDGFAAAFVHGIVSQWPLEEVAAFSNRLGACVAGARGAIPDWAGR